MEFDMNRDKKLRQLIVGVCDETIPFEFINQNNYDEIVCPFCYERKYLITDDDKYFELEHITHKTDCLYLLAKDLKKTLTWEII
jgi:hypothetical protein